MLDKLTECDAVKKGFDGLVWQEFPKSIRVLLDHPESLWGDAVYPVVK